MQTLGLHQHCICITVHLIVVSVIVDLDVRTPELRSHEWFLIGHALESLSIVFPSHIDMSSFISAISWLEFNVCLVWTDNCVRIGHGSKFLNNDSIIIWLTVCYNELGRNTSTCQIADISNTTLLVNMLYFKD